MPYLYIIQKFKKPEINPPNSTSPNQYKYSSPNIEIVTLFKNSTELSVK